jgi:16S rRNA (guanine1516-N2)-methyltransferase
VGDGVFLGDGNLKLAIRAESITDNPILEEAIALFRDSLVDSTDAEVILIREKKSWRLEDREGLKLCIDFDEVGPDYRRQGARGKQELIARAVGSQRGAKRILDLSAGLGQDAVFLCQLGFEVTAVERHPLLAFLLKEAAKASQREELKRLRILHGDAIVLLKDAEFLAGFDAGYFDPMYPQRCGSFALWSEMTKTQLT